MCTFQWLKWRERKKCQIKYYILIFVLFGPLRFCNAESRKYFRWSSSLMSTIISIISKCSSVFINDIYAAIAQLIINVSLIFQFTSILPWNTCFNGLIHYQVRSAIVFSARVYVNVAIYLWIIIMSRILIHFSNDQMTSFLFVFKDISFNWVLFLNKFLIEQILNININIIYCKVIILNN